MPLCSYSGAFLTASSLLVAGCTAAPTPMSIGDPPAAGMVVPGTDPSCSVGFPEYSCLSPDGSTVVFAWSGDLWSASIDGGACSRLTVHPADERRSASSAKLRTGPCRGTWGAPAARIRARTPLIRLPRRERLCRKWVLRVKPTRRKLPLLWWVLPGHRASPGTSEARDRRSARSSN